jgi:glycosyltransferase involved in cell wall biosynthesis
MINQYAGSPYHGMNLRSYYFAKEFIKYGHRVTIFAASYAHVRNKNPENINKLFVNENIDGIKYVWVKTPEYKKSKSLGRVLNLFIFPICLFFYNIKKIGKPDVIIISSPPPVPVLNAYKFSRRSKALLVFEVRDLWPLSLVELGGFSRYNPLVQLIQLIENFSYKKADTVISVIPLAGDHMIRHYMKEDKFQYVPNGIDLEEFKKSEKPDVEKEDLIPKNKFIVGYAGTVGIANALEYLIDAARLVRDFKDIHFIVLGGGGEKQRLVDKAGDLENITFIDSVPKLQVMEFLGLFDVCYIGLKGQTLFSHGVSANKLFEYMYAGKPIIYSINSGNNPVADAGCGISVQAENAEKISDAVIGLYKISAGERKKMGERGKEFVIKNHSYKELAKKYLKAIDVI